MSEAELEGIMDDIINNVMTSIPVYLQEIKNSNEIFKVENAQEFVYGIIMGMALGIGSGIFTAQAKEPTAEDQIKIRDIVYKRIPEIRKRIFN